MFTRSVPVFFCCLMLLPGLAGGAAPPKSDLELLQGKWAAKEDKGEFQLTFGKDTFELVMAPIGTERSGVFKGTVNLDSTKTPKEIDLAITSSPKDKFNGQTSHGIYELTGDTLKWCALEPGDKGRPKEFKGGGPGQMFLTFKRVK